MLAAHGTECAHLQAHVPAASLERILFRRRDAAGLVRNMEPVQCGGVPLQLVIVGRHNGGYVRLCAVLIAILELLSHLVLDVYDGGVRRKVRVRVVPAHAPASQTAVLSHPLSMCATAQCISYTIQLRSRIEGPSADVILTSSNISNCAILAANHAWQQTTCVNAVQSIHCNIICMQGKGAQHA